MNDEYDSNEIDLNGILNSLLRNKKLIFFGSFLITFSTVIFTYISKPVWSGSFQIIVKKRISDVKPTTLTPSSVKLDGSNIFKIRGQSNKTEEFILNSPSVLMPVFDYVKKEELKKNIDYGNLTYSKWLKDNWIIEFEKDSDVLTVEYRNPDKDLIISTLKLVTKKYQEYSKTDREKGITREIAYLEARKNELAESTSNSLKKLNDFSIKHGLTNLDSFVQIKKSSIPDVDEKEQRFQSQFDLLQEYESKYLELSAFFRKESNVLKSLKLKIDNIKESLKRPNEILLTYRDLRNQARRNELLLDNIENNLSIAILEKVRQPDPWKKISEPTISQFRVSPKRKQITILAFILSFMFTSAFAIFKEKISGVIYNLNDFKNNLPFKYLDKLFFKNDINDSLIESFSKYKEIKNIGVLFLCDKDYENIDDIIPKNNNIKLINISDKKSIEGCQEIFIIARFGTITLNKLEIMNTKLSLIKNKITGWFLFEDNKKYKI